MIAHAPRMPDDDDRRGQNPLDSSGPVNESASPGGTSSTAIASSTVSAPVRIQSRAAATIRRRCRMPVTSSSAPATIAHALSTQTR